MAKPICIIKYQDELSFRNGEIASIAEVNDLFVDKFNDYHVFCFPQNSMDDIFAFQVFHEKDFSEIQYQELRDLISAELNSK